MAEEFIPLGLDIMEFHDNFPPRTRALAKSIKSELAAGQKAGLPVWLTEWQRVRKSGSGFGKQAVAAGELMPNYASLAPTVRSYPVGSFFWCLMVKRAYLKGQREKGTVNGLFWLDGAVESLKDAQTIADDPALHLHERPISASFNNASPQ